MVSRAIHWHEPALFRVAKFGFCPNEEAWLANRSRVLRTAAFELSQYPHPGASGMFTFWKDFRGTPHGLLSIHDRYDRDPIGALGVIAHEAVHLVEMIFEAASEKAPGEETRAYLTEWCVRTIWLDYVKSGRAPKTMRGAA